MSDLLVVSAKIRGTHPYSFRSGEWATITGVKYCTPMGLGPRLVYESTYEDGVIDYIAISDSGNYEIIASPEQTND